MILFCFSYAGGSAMFYKKWQKYLGEEIKVVPVELQGHGIRYKEKLVNNLEVICEDMYKIVKAHITNDKFMFLGHSLGGLIAFEFYYYLKKREKKQPTALFILGCKAPMYLKLPFALSSDDEKLWKDINSLGGIPDKVNRNESLKKFFLPVLKNDFSIIKNYIFNKNRTLVSSKMVLISGDKDPLSPNSKEEWQLLCKDKADIYFLEGNHFFVLNNGKSISEIVKKIMNKMEVEKNGIS